MTKDDAERYAHKLRTIRPYYKTEVSEDFRGDGYYVSLMDTSGNFLCDAETTERAEMILTMLRIFFGKAKTIPKHPDSSPEGVTNHRQI